jgi:hypothetical protein
MVAAHDEVPMYDESARPAFVQIGNRNTQHNHYYNGSAGVSSHGTTGLVEGDVLGHFALVARLAAVSTQTTVMNTTMEEMNRRAARPSSPVDDLLLCRRLAPIIAEHGDWQLRRAFSRSLAYTMTTVSGHDEVVHQISYDLLDYARTSANFSVMLSIASTASRSAALQFSGNVQDMYAFTHPQVLWQHSRNPSLSTAHGGLRPLIDAVLDREDPWIRRRLVSSCLLHASRDGPGHTDETTRLLATLRGDDVRYMRLVLEWIDPFGRLDVPNALSSRLIKNMAREQLPPTRVGLESLPTADPSLVRTNLEKLSLDLDMQKMSAVMSADQSMAGGSSKGRYSTIEDTIAYVMGSVQSDLRENLVIELLDSFDEGIRWAVAAQFDLGLPQGRIGDAEAAQVLRLLADPHPWVIRESFTTLARTGLALDEPNFQRLAANAIAALGRAEALGWPRSELVPAMAALMASTPAIAEHVDLTVRER